MSPEAEPGHQPPAVAAPRPGLARLTALVEVLLCSGFPTQLALALVLSSAGIASVGQTGDLSLSYVVALSLGDAVLLVALILYFLHQHGERPQEVFLGTRPPRQEVVLGLVLIPLTIMLAAGGLRLLHEVWPWIRNVSENPLEALIASPLDAMVFMFVAIVAGAVREEIQRAFVLRRFEQHLGGGWVGLVIFSVVFGLGHYVQGWDAAVVTGTLGAMWGVTYLLRRSILAAMISHAGFNAAEILIALTNVPSAS